MPALRSLVQRHRDDPFVLIGVNEGDDERALRAGIEEHGVDWPVAWQGDPAQAPQGGPVTRLYRVRAFPTIFVIDADGVIRHRDLRGAALDRAVAALLAELEAEDGE